MNHPLRPPIRASTASLRAGVRPAGVDAWLPIGERPSSSQPPEWAVLVSLAALALLTACSSTPPRNLADGDDPAAARHSAHQHGTVSRIDVVAIASRSPASGAVLSEVIGTVIGTQVGRGIGRFAASGPGAARGALIGSRAESLSKADNEVFRVSVRLDNGRSAQFDCERIDDLRVGDRIKVEEGQLHRV
ncbi:MAG: hypothetical protein Q8N44_18315 [Rubrivivax sp.]|nr:hypothetical protein [Rubrivivax sp.]